MQLLFRVGLIPATLLVLTGLYWFHISDAPAVAQRVPAVAVALVVLLAIMVFVTELRSELKDKGRTGTEPASVAIKAWVTEWRLQIVFVALCVLHFMVFSTLGFNVANMLFLSLALPVAGFARDSGAGVRTLKVVSTAFLISVTVYALAHVMDFNIPLGPLGF